MILTVGHSTKAAIAPDATSAEVHNRGASELLTRKVAQQCHDMTTGGHGTQCPGRQVLLVRHGQSLHNAHHDVDEVLRDPMLSELGHAQAASLRSVPFVSAGCELLVVSPLSRAIQTASAVFGELPMCRTVLTPLHSERWCSIADEGRSKSELLQLFPFVASWEGFAELPEDWTPTCQEAAWKTERVPAFLDWLAAQPEQLGYRPLQQYPTMP
ncbi:unnamed protein product [Cladocopium goreaui]|uniref:Probable phosphatase SPAC5H10.03 n=1 Tax=Cladocopium goreaui TaxID=2562237 RepID=A0A9P1BL63_9DINO|nr:unnamed protein product [Cladocopium goreaui]